MSGTISWDELKSFIERMEDEHDFELSDDEWEQVHGMFSHVDADGSGEVDKKEFEAVFKSQGLSQLKRAMKAKKWATHFNRNKHPVRWSSFDLIINF